jgi:phosphoribulokinase
MQTRPIIIGIVGDSGSGKSTMARGVRAILGDANVTHLCADDYHRFDRAERAERGLTPLHPLANHLDIMELDLERLKAGLPILKPVYDHRDGTLRRPEHVRPRDFVIVEGLLCFHPAKARALFDVRVYLEPAERVRRGWKLRRDIARRGYTEAAVLTELEQREPDAATYIRPQRQHADIVVQFAPPSARSASTPTTALDARLVLRPTLEHPDLSDLLGQRTGAELRLELGRDGGRPVDFLEIDHRIDAAQARALESAIWGHLEGRHPAPHERFGLFHDGTAARHSDQLALVQLLLTYHLLSKRGESSRMPQPVPRFPSTALDALSRAPLEGVLP